jgi:hypothetical protein
MGVCYSVLIYSQYRGILFITPIFGGALSGGLYYYFLRKVRGQSATLGDLFCGFTKPFLSLLVAGFLISILVTVGIFCLVLPGIYLAVVLRLHPGPDRRQEARVLGGHGDEPQGRDQAVVARASASCSSASPSSWSASRPS